MNVVAHWVLSYGLEGGGGIDMELMETVTGPDGRFSFPSWGPKPIPAGLPLVARMKNQDPEMILFKSGYSFRALSNEIRRPQPDAGSPVRSSEWDGETLELKKFSGTQEQYGLAVGSVLTGVSYGRCEWKKIPRMVLALNHEAEQLKRAKAFNYTVAHPSIAYLEATAAADGCGPVAPFLKGYEQ